MNAKRPCLSTFLRALLAAMLGLGALAGCDSQLEGEVRVSAIGERLPRLADPASGTLTPPDLLLVSNAAQGLVGFDAAGNIVPALAERWAVSNDGMSYVFRLRTAEWTDGRRLRARDVVRLLERQLARSSRNPLKDTAGAIRQVVAMTDRVVAVELSAPRPHLLQLLAQPEFGLVREGRGSGPFTLTREGEALLLSRRLPGFEDEEGEEERVRLSVHPAEQAITQFKAGQVDLVLGGTSGDLALALGAGLPGGTLRIDPVAGLFGLVPVRGLGRDEDVRKLLDEAIDRQALVAALGVPQLQPRTSLLQPGLDGIAAPAEPAWAAVPLPQRRAELVERARRLFAPASEEAEEEAGSTDPRRGEFLAQVRVAVPPGPGGEIILQRLREDWGPLFVDVQGSEARTADFLFIDRVAPSTSPAWFLRSFRCEAAAVCLPQTDQLLDAARLTGFAPQRSTFFAEAERQMREAALFIPVAAPIRWSLTGKGITGFAENRFARHPLTGLRERQATRD
jgi:peptide/nickel transport system substrate-binding protein